MRRWLVLGGASLMLVSCSSAAAPQASVNEPIAVDCFDTSPCEGEVSVHTAELGDQCRYGLRTWADGDGGFGIAGPGERYLEVTATLTAISSENPDGVLLDEMEIVAGGETSLAQRATACNEAENASVFWTKNVQPGQSADIYQPWIVPEGTEAIIVEDHVFELQ